MNIINKYITFWIENWYKPKWLISYHKDDILKYVSIIDWINLEWSLDLWINYNNNVNWLFIYDVYFNEMYSLEKEITSKEFIEAIARWIYSKLWYSKWVDIITSKQAIAIRDDRLWEYIINLWIWKQS